MELIRQFITQNECYQTNRTIVPKGIMVHSTATPGVLAKSWYSRWNKSGIEVAVHAFVDDTCVCQHLPWNHRAWHCGASGNNTHIAFEMCEPSDWTTNRAYLEACWRNAVELAAYLCKQYGLNETDIVSHREGYALGIASNHGDPDHWWGYFGRTMDEFRADVKATLAAGAVSVGEPAVTEYPTLKKGSTGSAVAELQKRLNYCRQRLALSFDTLAEDGIFGAATDRAVRIFQTARHLSADGIAGPLTWTAVNWSYGDVNADAKVTPADAQMALQAAVGKRALTEDQQHVSDMDGDGKITASDAAQILRRSVGK